MNISPAVLNSLSHVAEAGSAVLSLTDRLNTVGKDVSTSIASHGHPK